jgi:hypothetical protein
LGLEYGPFTKRVCARSFGYLSGVGGVGGTAVARASAAAAGTIGKHKRVSRY